MVILCCSGVIVWLVGLGIGVLHLRVLRCRGLIGSAPDNLHVIRAAMSSARLAVRWSRHDIPAKPPPACPAALAPRLALSSVL